MWDVPDEIIVSCEIPSVHGGRGILPLDDASPLLLLSLVLVIMLMAALTSVFRWVVVTVTMSMTMAMATALLSTGVCPI